MNDLEKLVNDQAALIKVLRRDNDQFIRERHNARQSLFDFAEAYRANDQLKIEVILEKVDLSRGAGKRYEWPVSGVKP
jgi:hypothetical protein